MPDKLSLLGWINLLLPKDRVGQVVEDVAYGAHARHRLDIYCPPGPAGVARPVLFFIYGGGWDSGTKSDYAFAGRAFAAAGFVTVIADYRVVPEVHYPEFLNDNGAALHWLAAEISRFGGDWERLFFMGHSAGAYNAAMLGLAGERLGAPPLKGRLKGVVGLSGPYDFYPFDVAASINAFSRAPDPEATQPVNLVSRGAPDFYLGHGSADPTCGLYNTRNFAAALRAEQVEVLERHYPGRKHAAPLLSLFPLLRWLTPAYGEAVAFMRARAGG